MTLIADDREAERTKIGNRKENRMNLTIRANRSQAKETVEINTKEGLPAPLVSTPDMLPLR